MEAVSRVLLVVLLVITMPMAVLAGRATSTAEADRNLPYTQTLQQVEATVFDIRKSGPSRVPSLVRNVGVEWTQAFQERREYVSLRDTVQVGDRLTLWIDEAGRPTDPAKLSERARSAGVGAGLAVWTGTALLAMAAFAVLRARLDRRRYAEWDRQWLLLGSGNGRANRDH